MAAETTTTKLNAESHLLLDQSLLRLPHELVRRNFKSTQRYVEREKDYILPALKETANASLNSSQTPEQTLASLDAIIARMNTLKRKLQTLHDEEQDLQSHSSKRIKHLEALYEIPSLSDQKYEEWSRVRLDRLMADYLLRSGYSQTATALAQERDISDLVDLDVFTSCHKIQSSIQQGETQLALAWCNENRAALKKLPATQKPSHNLEFELRLQQYIELVRIGTTPKKLEAMSHAQKYLIAHAATQNDEIMHAAGLLAQPEATETEPYASMFCAKRWTFLSDLFVATHHTLFALPTTPPFHVALSAGLSALKTPACHSEFNPVFSSPTPTSAEAGANTTTTTTTPTAAKKVLATANTSLCPICSIELNELARSVPYAHHTKSYVENDPVVLPNGRVYGRERLEELQRKLAGGVGEVGVGDVRDPTTAEVFSWDDVRKVYVT